VTAAGLRFTAGQPAVPLRPDELPAAPGGGIWCDLPREALGEAPWVWHLHPLTAASLAAGRRRHLAAVQPGYVHVRIEALGHGGGTADRRQLERPGAALRGPAEARLPRQPLDIVVGSGFVLTVGARQTASSAAIWGDYAEGRRKADRPDFALYQAMSTVVAAYRREGLALLAAAESITQRLVRISERHILGQIVAVRQRALDLRDVVAPAVDALRLLADAEGVAEDTRPYCTDLCRQAQEVLNGINGARDTMAEAVEAYTSVQSTEMNRVMQIFTVVAVIFGPPTLIASIYGMNFRIPEYRWPFGYSWALGLMLTVTLALLGYLRRRHWL
jgi:magnesium/cobalt transport protein CorA